MIKGERALELDGVRVNARLDAVLCPFAQKNSDSQGRKYPEPLDPDRSPFQRDRDRILHASAFRRLAGKMQVVSPKHGDHFRNRLTHTLEVSQIARDLARQLELNEDLSEAIALAHDLGHPPFGHAGEAALDKELRRFGRRFEHNEQSLRIVDVFERRYPDFLGLNLTREVREGMDKHQTFFDRSDTVFRAGSLESQLVNVADEIAYLSADLEDGVRGGFFQLSDLRVVPLVARVLSERGEDRSSVVRGVLRQLITDLVENSRLVLAEGVIGFTDSQRGEFLQLKNFLFDNYYSASAVKAQTEHGAEVIAHLFSEIEKNPDLLPEYLQQGKDSLEIRIADFIAGMTDRFAEEFLMLSD
jgi:dGTPase